LREEHEETVETLVEMRIFFRFEELEAKVCRNVSDCVVQNKEWE